MKKQILAKLNKGYQRLTTFETSTKGYEWFGNSPAHETLTAYGLMQFNDMMAVGINVDGAMVNRTRDWIISRKDTEKVGSFKVNPRQLDSFGGSTETINNAYIVWALTSLQHFSYEVLEDEFNYL